MILTASCCTLRRATTNVPKRVFFRLEYLAWGSKCPGSSVLQCDSQTQTPPTSEVGKRMQVESKSAVVPADISADVEEIVKAIKSAAEQQGQSADDAIPIVRPQGRGMVPGGLETVILIVCSGAPSFTKKWIHAFVWPR